MIEDRGLNPVGLDRDGHLHRLTFSRSVQDRIRRRLVDGEDDLLGDLAGHLAQASSSRAAKAGKVGGEGGIVSCIAGSPFGQRLSSCGSDAYPGDPSLPKVSKPSSGSGKEGTRG